MKRNLKLSTFLIAVVCCGFSSLAGAEEPKNLPGTYAVEGNNANGIAYDGFATIVKDGDHYLVKWNVGGQKYRGTGKLEGNILTVDWGQNFPVVYTILPDGRLDGKWGGGKASEILVP